MILFCPQYLLCNDHWFVTGTILQASGPQTEVPASGAWIRWMVRSTKLPLWALQQQQPTQHSCLQQLRDARQVVSHLSAQIYIRADRKRGRKSIKISTWLRGICLAAALDDLSLSPPLLPLYQLCLCIPFSAHLFSPKQPYAYSGSLELAAWHVFRLAVGLISAAYLSPGRIHTHWQTHTRLHALQRQQVVLAVCWDTWRKRSIRKKDASHCFPPRGATLHQRLITVPSAHLSWGFPKYIVQLKLTIWERKTFLRAPCNQFPRRFS